MWAIKKKEFKKSGGTIRYGFCQIRYWKIREQNQDYYYIPSSDSDLKLYILADGMGGYKGGEVASKMATEAVKEYVHLNFQKQEA